MYESTCNFEYLYAHIHRYIYIYIDIYLLIYMRIAWERNGLSGVYHRKQGSAPGECKSGLGALDVLHVRQAFWVCLKREKNPKNEGFLLAPM